MYPQKFMSDLTGILVPEGQLSPEEIVQAVRARPYGDVFLRIKALPSVKLVQVEVHDTQRGYPCEDPELVATLSQKGRAAFVHVNNQAKQALLHAFVSGQGQEGVATEPGAAFENKLREAVGSEMEALVKADDGSRVGIGIAASQTVALVGGRVMQVPRGMPTALSSFQFHDRGNGMDDGGERMAFIAFDPEQAQRAYFDESGETLRAHLAQAPEGVFGPLESARPEVDEVLGSLGEKTARATGLKHVRAFELCAMASTLAFSGGESLSYWNERVLPMFSLSDQDPVFDPSEIEDLEEETHILRAMVDVLPYSAPPDGEGSMLPMIADREIGPLAPWAREEPEYHGSIFMLKADRLLELVRKLDGQRMGALVERFEKAWYRAVRPGQPEGDALLQWRKAREEEGQKDLNRFGVAWAELRALLELAASNKLTVGMVFYG